MPLQSFEQIIYGGSQIPKDEFFRLITEGSQVSIREIPGMGRGLFADKDFEVDETIFIEVPLISVTRNVTCCGYCVHPLPEDPEKCSACQTKYCSSECKEEDFRQCHEVLCGGEIDSPSYESLKKGSKSPSKRRKKSPFSSLLLLCQEEERVYPVLIARIFAYITLQHMRGEPSDSRCWNYLSCWIGPAAFQSDEQHFDLIFQIFKHTPIAHLVTRERYSELLTLITRYAYGINTCEKDEDGAREDGVGIYQKGSFFNHNCAPNVTRDFSKNDFYVEFSAMEPIKKGQQLFAEYVVRSKPVKSRRKKLLRNYGFLCNCERCVEELAELKPKRRRKPLSRPSKSSPNFLKSD